MKTTPHQRELDTSSKPQLTHVLFPFFTTTHEVSAISPSTLVPVTSTQGSPPQRHPSLEGHIMEFTNQDVNFIMTPFRGPSEPEKLTTPALVDLELPPDLEADLALSDSSDSDIGRSVQEEILQLHRKARMSLQELAKTVIKTVWPI